MTYVTDFEHDIFVSYAHVDDEPLMPEERGWVTTLTGCIKTRLAQMLGRSDSFSLWMDYELEGHRPLTPQILDAARRTAILMVVLSPGYVASNWCRREKDEFLRVIQQHGRVFVLERDYVGETERPDEFKDLKGFRFWVRDREGKPPRILGTPRPDSADTEYYRQVDDLCFELSTALRRLKSENREVSPRPIAGQTADAASPEETKTVFIAQVTDDLESKRSEVRRYLNQYGAAVVPTDWYPLEPSTFREAAERDLAKADLFVQLLSDVPGKRPPDLPEGYSKLQLDLARELDKPVMQWRDPDIDTATVEVEDHRLLLDGRDVRAEGLEDFKRAICLTLAEPAPLSYDPVDALVFVNMESMDRRLGEEVCTALDQYGASYSIPIRGEDPGENRRDLERNFQTCDAVIIVYGTSTASWVRNQLLECRKAIASRHRPLKALAVFEGPPEPKDQLGMKLRNVQILNCRKGLDETEFKHFLDQI